MFWSKPKYLLEVKQGEAGAWRWTARSTDVQLVGNKSYIANEIIALCHVRGFLAEDIALAAGKAAMRGWKRA